MNTVCCHKCDGKRYFFIDIIRKIWYYNYVYGICSKIEIWRGMYEKKVFINYKYDACCIYFTFFGIL